MNILPIKLYINERNYFHLIKLHLHVLKPRETFFGKVYEYIIQFYPSILNSAVRSARF